MFIDEEFFKKLLSEFQRLDKIITKITLDKLAGRQEFLIIEAYNKSFMFYQKLKDKEYSKSMNPDLFNFASNLNILSLSLEAYKYKK